MSNEPIEIPTSAGVAPAELPKMTVQEIAPPLQCAAELSGEIQTIHTPRPCQSEGCYPNFHPDSKLSSQS